MQESDALAAALGITLRPGLQQEQSPERLWQDLATTAECGGIRPSGQELAGRVNDNPFADEFVLSVGVTVVKILGCAGDDEEGRQVLADVSDLVTHLQPAHVAGLLRAEPEARHRLAFLELAMSRLTLPAAFRLVSALGGVAGRPLSEPLRRQLRKMAQRLNTLPGDLRLAAEEPLRSTLSDLVVDLITKPAPGHASGASLLRPARKHSERASPEPERVIQLAIELETQGEPLWIALNDFVETSGLGPLVEMVTLAPAESPTTAAIMKRVATPQALARLLEQDPVDERTLDAFLHGLGIAAVRVLLEALVESRLTGTRKVVLDRLARFGPQIQPLVEGRLKDNRWFVQRNMIGLLRAAGCTPDVTLASRFLESNDARVRREAVLWCLESPQTKERAIVEGLRDGNADVLRPALQAARAGLPQAAVPVLAKRVLDADFPPAFRVLSLNLLGRSGSALALEALLHYAISGKTFLGRPRLAPKAPEMLAAVTALARTWRSDRRARGILDQALKSRDSQVVAAAKTGSVEMS